MTIAPMKIVMHLNVIALILLFSISECFAQTTSLTLRSQSDRDQCISALIQSYPDIEDIREFKKNSLCQFIQFNYVEDVRVFLNESLTANLDFNTLSVRQAEVLLGENHSAKREAAQRKLSIIKDDALFLAREVARKAVTAQQSQDFDRYTGAVFAYAPKVSLDTLTSNYKAYSGLPANITGSFFAFEPSSERFPADIDRDFDFALRGEGSLSNCRQDCKLYIENYLLAGLWDETWGLNSQKPVAQTRAKIRSALDEYDYFFFEAGDGLYPWELWVNSWGKTDNVFEVPKTKINVLHPSPVVYYDNLQGNIDPSMLIEVIGVTKLNYSKLGSLPIGASAAVDFQNDNIRYGAVVHLPIKGAFKRIGLEPVSKIIPCEACSIAFLTDGDDDWSVGLKIDIAGLLYSKDKAKSTFLDFIK